MEGRKVAIVGSGNIGKSYAKVFAAGGYEVVLYDIVPDRVTAALKHIKEQLEMFEENGCLRGTESAERQLQRITGSSSLKECVEGAMYIQECIPERLGLKKDLFRELDSLVDDKVVLASATSCIMPSKFSEDLKHRAQCIVAHPINPPYLVPLVEVVPAPWTKPDVVSFTRSLLEEVGQAPITLSKEVNGFAVNRIQFSILNECWRLVEDGVLSVKDVDTAMSAGLGRRYAFLGALEATYLNADGTFSDYCKTYGPSIVEVTKELGPVPSWEADSEGAKIIGEQLQELSPVEIRQERRDWRDQKLAALSKLTS